jgi:hypothetical protein
MKVAETAISQAIWALQEALRDTPEEFVVRLGCKFPTYSQWVKGERVPGGEWMLEILALCPDKKTFDNFFVDIKKRGSKIPSTSRPEMPKEEVKGVLYPGGTRSDVKFSPKHSKPRPGSR